MAKSEWSFATATELSAALAKLAELIEREFGGFVPPTAFDD